MATKLQESKMDSGKLISMLKSEDDAMADLAIAICKGGSLKKMDPLERVILFLHAEDRELARMGFKVMKSLEKKIRYLEELAEYYKEYSDEGRSAFLEIQRMYMNTKKLRGFFYTEEEFKKVQEKGGGTFVTKKDTFWEWHHQIQIKNFKQKHHGKK